MSESQNAASETFLQYFSVKIADADDIRTIQRLRFDVYAVEFGYEKPDAFPEQLEVDEYDDESTHCLITHLETGKPAGCVRMVPALGPADTRPMPLERYCAEAIDQEYIDGLHLPRETVCEISRLAVHGDFRRRGAKERETRFGHVGEDQFSPEELRTFPLIAVSAFLASTAITYESRRTNVFAMMEPFLPRMLKRSGIVFEGAGDTIEYHGNRAPYFIKTQSAIDGMIQPLRILYDSIHEQLYGGPGGSSIVAA